MKSLVYSKKFFSNNIKKLAISYLFKTISKYLFIFNSKLINFRKYIKINNDFFISKYEHKNLVTFEWISTKKNDIAADHLAFLLSQFPDDPEFDLFYEDDMPKTQQSIKNLLLANFPKIHIDESKNFITIVNGDSQAVVNLNNNVIKNYNLLFY